MRQSGWVLSGVAAAVLVAIAWAVAGKLARQEEGGDKPAAQAALEFSASEVVQPQNQALGSIIEFSGPLQAPQSATVRSRVAATLMQLEVQEGSRVRAGQRLATLDMADLNARLLERQAQLEAARVSQSQAERTHQSNQRLADQQFISPLALEASRSALDSARAQVQVATAQLDALKVALREAALVSPISGIVAKRLAVAGEKLAAEQPVLSIVDLRTLEMAGSVGTHEVAALKPGMTVQLRVEGEAAPRTAVISRIAPAAEPGTRAIGVTVSVNNADEALRAGQFASAQVQLPGQRTGLTVPATALVVASGQEYLWTVEQGKLVRRTVTTGRRDPVLGRVEVLTGLPAEALVLAARFENLREGAEARAKGQALAGPVPASSPERTASSAATAASR